MKTPLNEDLSNFKKLDSQPIKGCKPVRTAMAVEAVIENTEKQPLKVIRPFNVIASSIPGNLSVSAQTVMKCLFDVFTKSGNVQEGIVRDVIWGFEQSGHAPAMSIEGIRELIKNGYLKLRAPNGIILFALEKESDLSCWLQYEPKLLELLYERPAHK